MKKEIRLLALGSLCLCALPSRAGLLEDGFRAPPESTRLQTWFHWIGDCVTKEGLAADLKAMGEMEIGAAHVFMPSMANLPITAKPLTPKWFELWRTALREAKKNNIRLGFHNCPGWSSSGGPWITPETAMKMLVASETDYDPAAPKASLALAQPLTKLDYYRDIAVMAFPVTRAPRLVRASGDFPGDFDAFRDGTKTLVLPLKKPDGRCTLTLEYDRPFSPNMAIYELDIGNFYARGDIEASADGQTWSKCRDWNLAFFGAQRTPKTMPLGRAPKDVRFFRIRFSAQPVPPWIQRADYPLKSFAFTDLPHVGDLDAHNSSATQIGYAAPRGPAAPGVAASAFVDLTSAFSSGAVDLAALNAKPAPSAKVWRILRIGYTCTGRTCAPATIRGLECDKLSKKGLDAHWPNMPQRMLAEPDAKDVVSISIIDSYEVGGQNWTEAMPDEFRARRGYDLRPWLPALAAGYVVGTAGETAKALFDFQRTVADLFAENYYDYFVELCHRAGIEAACEPYGGPFDSLRCGARADVPTGEFWLGRAPHNSPRIAASIGHLNGRARIAAESFTTEAKAGRWQITPSELRRSGDAGWLNGISQIVYHSYLHQPFGDVKPGTSLGRHGTQLNRNTTWWPEGVHWSRYVRRGQFLLQRGTPRAEVLVFVGDSTPNAYHYAADVVAAGANFDYAGASNLPTLSVAPDGRLVAPGGAAYDVLYLGRDRHLTAATLRELKRLVEAGARVAGEKPTDSPSLADDPAAWKSLVDSIWANGRVKKAGSPLAAIKAFGVRPAVESGERLHALHRVADGRDIFFILNERDAAFDGVVSFAAAGAPERWDARDASIAPLAVVKENAETGRVRARLALPAHGSCFVVFDPKKQPTLFADEKAAPKPETVLADFSPDWTITSFKGPNAPDAPLALVKLASWSEANDPKLKYFAGRAVYEKSVTVPANAKNGAVLDLGMVRDVANVWANGRFLGCLWEAPYRVALPGDLAKPGATLELKIEVVNTWPNRLIGDAIARRNGAAEPMSKRGPWPQWVLDGKADSGTGIYTWSNFMGWSPDEPLLPAGLLGPVRLLLR